MIATTILNLYILYIYIFLNYFIIIFYYYIQLHYYIHYCIYSIYSKYITDKLISSYLISIYKFKHS